MGDNNPNQQWILAIEDNPSDVRLFQEAFREAGVQARLESVGNGPAAFILLHQRVAVEGNCPKLILLDLNLPKLDGITILSRLKSAPEYRRIPVIILSSSQDKRDVHSCYNQYANCYIVKPSSFEGLVAIAKGLNDFWLRIVSSPSIVRGQSA